MNTENRLKKLQEELKKLRLSGLRSACTEILQEAEAKHKTYLEFLEDLVRRELESRKKNRLVTCIRQAGLTEKYEKDDIQLPEGYGLNAFELKVLLDLLWVEEHFNLILIGPHGTGKTKLAKVLTTAAVADAIRAYYTTAAKLLEILMKMDSDPRFRKMYENILKCKLFVLDDMDEVNMGPKEALAFKVLIDYLKGRCSVMITSTRPIKDWKKVFYDESFGVSIVDRLKKRSEIITLNATSFRITLHEGFFSKYAKAYGDEESIN